MTDTEAIIVQEIDRRRAAERKADALVAAIRALPRHVHHADETKRWVDADELDAALARILGDPAQERP